MFTSCVQVVYFKSNESSYVNSQRGRKVIWVIYHLSLSLVSVYVLTGLLADRFCEIYEEVTLVQQVMEI